MCAALSAVDEGASSRESWGGSMEESLAIPWNEECANAFSLAADALSDEVVERIKRAQREHRHAYLVKATPSHFGGAFFSLCHSEGFSLRSDAEWIELDDNSWGALVPLLAVDRHPDVCFFVWGRGDAKAVLDWNSVFINGALCEETPFRIGDAFYLFGKKLWELTKAEVKLKPDLDEVKLLILDRIDKRRKTFERLRSKFSGEASRPHKREPIPEEVRIAVWRRDEAKCVKCGSQEKLEYDHIIPVSKGGSNTIRNVQLLCEACNRSKQDKIEG